MTTPTPDQIASYGTSALLAVFLGWEKFVNRKKAQKTEEEQQTLSEAMAFKARGDLMLQQVDEYKKLLEQEYISHQDTRNFHHGQATLAQEKLSRCNELCHELRARTDISRVEKLLIDQTTALMSIGAGVQKLLEKP